jgi:hypothetical protein
MRTADTFLQVPPIAISEPVGRVDGENTVQQTPPKQEPDYTYNEGVRSA